MNKNKNIRKRFDFAILILAILVFIVAGINIILSLLKYKAGRDAYNGLSDKYVSVNDDSSESETVESSTDNTDESWYTDISIDFHALEEVNDEIIGWIRFDDGSIDYPLLKTDDNEKYLTYGADLNTNVSGAIFVDCACANPFEDYYTIIYGHNMRDGSMFGKLKKLASDVDYLDENRYFTVYTASHAYRYRIFALYTVSADNEMIYRVGFTDNDEYAKLIDYMISSSSYFFDELPDKNSKIITLSTCSGETNRFIVNAYESDRYDY
ncbi:MAG: class B sortase [Lachnospiraceae bacterium]|nr:class B sortase [Lachnospiraceae bacterium]